MHVHAKQRQQTFSNSHKGNPITQFLTSSMSELGILDKLYDRSRLATTSSACSLIILSLLHLARSASSLISVQRAFTSMPHTSSQLEMDNLRGSSSARLLTSTLCIREGQAGLLVLGELLLLLLLLPLLLLHVAACF